MNKTIFAVIIVAIVWHLGLIGIRIYLKYSRKRDPFKRVLRLVELDLLESLREMVIEILEEDSVEVPSHIQLEEIEEWLKKVRKHDE